MSAGIRQNCHCLQGGHSLDKKPKKSNTPPSKSISGSGRHEKMRIYSGGTSQSVLGNFAVSWKNKLSTGSPVQTVDRLLHDPGPSISLFVLGRLVASVILGVDPIILANVDAGKTWRIDEGGHKIGFQG
ncbi:hypothetical protein PspLS_03793 [Pyricularia sp. CBS 133598]|nr:hypothetical protein PspLS_03793 [Pyricularia sp. CBS 133598]